MQLVLLLQLSIPIVEAITYQSLFVDIVPVGVNAAPDGPTTLTVIFSYWYSTAVAGTFTVMDGVSALTVIVMDWLLEA